MVGPAGGNGRGLAPTRPPAYLASRRAGGEAAGEPCPACLSVLCSTQAGSAAPGRRGGPGLCCSETEALPSGGGEQHQHDAQPCPHLCGAGPAAQAAAH